MERRRLLRRLLTLTKKDLTRLAKDGLLTSCDPEEIRTIREVVSCLYGRRLGIVANLERGATDVAKYALSPLKAEPCALVGTQDGFNTPQGYEIAKVGRREFLVVSGVLGAIVVGSSLYYVSPAFRALVNGILGGRQSRESASTATTKTYRMTVSTTWYYMPSREHEGYEMHFKTARHGRVEDVRRELASQGIAHFQQAIYEESGRWIPRRKLRVGFELEQPAARIQDTVVVHARHLVYRAGQWQSTPMPSGSFNYAEN